MIRSKRTRKLLRESRREGFLNDSILIVGEPGSGKNASYEPELLREVGRKFILILDQPDATGVSFLGKIAGRYSNVLEDNLSWHRQVLPVCLLDVTGDKRLDKVARERFVEIAAQAPELEDQYLGPQKRYYADLCCHLFQKIPKGTVPFRVSPRIFKTWDGWHRYLCDLCTDKSLIMPFVRGRALHESTRISTYSPSERFMERFLEEPAVQARDSFSPPPIETLIRENYVVVIRGGSPEEMQLIGSIWINMVINYFEDGGEGLARIVLDEFVSTGTLTTTVLSALRRRRKQGVSFTFIDTHLPEDLETLRTLDQCCATKYVHKCSSWDVALFVAKWFSGELNAKKVLKTTERSVFDGYQTTRVHRHTTSESRAPFGSIQDQRRSSSFQSYDADQATYRTVYDEQYQSLTDQQIEIAKEIQNGLMRGERKVCCHGETRNEYVELPRDRWPWERTRQRKLEEWLEYLHESDLYVTPDLKEPELPWRYRTPIGNGKSSTGSGRTHQHTSKSKKQASTQRTKQRKEQRPNGPNGDASST